MKRKRLVIIGAGSSGLVTLKNAIDQLPDWEISCFEKSKSTRGCWGNLYSGFVSTSTKYTTQFTSFKKWDSSADPASRPAKADFFLGDEYGRYLDEFADHFGLRNHIQLETTVHRIHKAEHGWKLSIDHIGVIREETFDKLIICTGLVTKAKHIDTEISLLKYSDAPPQNSTILVLGAGESGADIAHRLADPSLGNQIYLSLKTGVRVSPRYHPIRGVPSDFLRNRLMLSIHRDLRNTIGQKFVETRIRHQERFEKFFGGKSKSKEQPSDIAEKRKYWDSKLTAQAKDQLFNVFHTKSDDFLDDVAEGRITIIGPAHDSSHRKFSDFDREKTVEIEPDFVCQMIGFSSGLEDISGGKIKLSDFYEACVHVSHDDLFLIGFARPIIGNIPTISEMQAKYVTGIISGEFERPAEIESLHATQQEISNRIFKNLNTETIRPVEMFPYCDRLARMMGSYPTRDKIKSTKAWLKIFLAPASTTHYTDADYNSQEVQSDTIHSPIIITALLILIKAFQRPLLCLIKSEKI